jgi:hypothetical protein
MNVFLKNMEQTAFWSRIHFSGSLAVIPSWIDMQPEGDFIKSLYRTKMPESISFYMFYGHRGSRSPFRSNNDGTIALSSLLDCRSQSESKMNYAFNEDHTSILFSKEVLAQYNTILNKFDEKPSVSLQPSRGYLKTHLAYNYDFDVSVHQHRICFVIAL